jgi:hypothetical protein
MRVYRIRKTWAHAGGQNYASHADVIAPHWATALKAAREGRVTNWRAIDSWDSSNETYTEFEYLYEVRGQTKLPREPLKEIPTWFKERRDQCPPIPIPA